MSFPPIILLHVAAASAALMTGAFVLARAKGTTRHRQLGRAWVALMLITALSSFGIRTNGNLSWIHGLALWIIFSLGMGLLRIHQRNVIRHLRWMRGSYVGLLGAGMFSLMPHRRMGQLLLQSIGAL
ncbi:putative membrane protein [Actimicrobium sp. GrIS 1.19]|uniref:DUF2306 domain-containing protein n=1 Tax=Actimicrobium sp. GrIS 1.19 TaxID=3071708 RepID=UPI002E073A95|nr:putative membrane protein [Actimicrobium sp. GrIS 1.19]